MINQQKTTPILHGSPEWLEQVRHLTNKLNELELNISHIKVFLRTDLTTATFVARTCQLHLLAIANQLFKLQHEGH